jgi:hypothetical protein
MKNLFKYTLSFSMVLILLVSSLQFSVYKMDCLMSGNTQFSLSDFDDCNQKTTTKSVSQKCCEFGSLTFDFDYETDNNSPNLKITTSNLAITLFSINPTQKTIPQSNFNFYTNLSPPSGFELLKVVQVFRI